MKFYFFFFFFFCAIAVEASRQQLQSYRANQGARPFLEEFIPLKHSTPEGSEKASNMSDKANWMTSAQLWSPAGDETKQQSTVTSSKEPDIGFTVSPKLGFDNKQRNGGAFLPFSKERNSCPSPNLRALPDLALANSTDHKDVEDKKCSETENGMAFSRRENCGKVVNGGTGMEQVKTAITPSEAQTGGAAPTANSQTHRKARRCWSPDLHRRFVNALQMLGGSQGNLIHSLVLRYGKMVKTERLIIGPIIDFVSFLSFFYFFM